MPQGPEVCRTPPAEVSIDLALVSELLKQQHPDLGQLPLRAVASGWDNAMFRLGEDLAVRLPRRKAAASLIVHEQTWLPRLAPQLALPVPAPLRHGKPTGLYPWCWSVVPWLEGTPADETPPQASQAGRFAAFLRSLHVPAPQSAPANPVRGVPLHHRAAVVEARMQRLATRTCLITSQITRLWQQALRAPIDVPATWVHGDLHPRNILVEQGEITGILDWGDITSGDCATDLASLWMLFPDPHARETTLAAYGEVSPATLQRAKGWALAFALALLETGLTDHPRHAAIGENTLRHLCQ